MKHGLDYHREKDEPNSKEKWSLWERFIREGNYNPYKEKPEPLFLEGKKISGFEIFMDYLGKKSMNELILEEPIVDEEVVAATVELATDKKNIAKKAVDAITRKDSKGKGITTEIVKNATKDADQSETAMDLETFI